MNELEVTPRRLGQIWWAMVWRGVLALLMATTLYAIACGIVLALAKAFIFHWSAGQMHAMTHFLGAIGVAPGCVFASLVAIRMALRTRYQGFRIALVSSD